MSGLLWHGPPRDLLDAARDGRVVLVTNPLLLVELEEVLRRPKFAARLSSAGVTPEGLRQGYAALALVIPAAAAAPVVDADPDDDVVLACAVAANADLIVTGDQHLLALKGHGQISICTAMEALTRLDAHTPP